MATLDFFLQNWIAEVGVDTAYLTDITRSHTTLSEARRSLLGRPLRTVRIRWTGINRNESIRILMALFRAGNDPIEVPLYSDQAVVSSAIGNTINCDAVDKRFHVDKKIVIHSFDANGRPTNVQRGVIQTVSPTQIITVAGIGTHGNARVYPILDVIPVLDGRVTFLHDNTGELQITFRESAEGARLPEIVANFGDNPSGFPTYTRPGGVALPIFDRVPNWADGMPLLMVRPGEDFFRGRGPVVNLRGSRPLFKFVLDLLFDNRFDFFNVLKFFDSRRGRCLPFYLPNPVALWESVSVTPFFVIKEDGNIDDLTDFVDFACIVENDNTIHIREITGVVDLGNSWELLLDSSMPGIPAEDIRRVCPAHLVRLSEDTLTERWTTDTVFNITLSAEEILEEKRIEVTDL